MVKMRSQPTLLKEEREFEDYEDEHDDAFGGYTRVSCFAHTLQLVGKFSEVRSCSAIVKKAHGLVKKSEQLYKSN